MAVRKAIIHYERDFLQGVDVFQRISRNSDDVGCQAQRAGATRPP
jgi:hypothetical protein